MDTVDGTADFVSARLAALATLVSVHEMSAPGCGVIASDPLNAAPLGSPVCTPLASVQVIVLFA